MDYWTIFCSKPVTFSMIPITSTYTTEKSHSWDAKRSSGSQITRILWNPQVHYHIHMSLPPVLIPSQINPVHIPPHPTLWWYILILSSHLCLCLKNGLFPSGFTIKTLHAPLPPPHTCYIPRPSHPSLLDHQKNIGYEVQIMKLLIMQSSQLPYYLIPLKLKYLPPHCILNHPHPMFLPQCEELSFKSIWPNM